jgi:ribonuclease Z
VSSYIHTPPAAFGKIMSMVKPRLAVGYHSILVPEMHQQILEGVRTTYDGPLIIADDLMAWTVTKEAIVQREVVSAERVQPPQPSLEYVKANRSGEAIVSDYITAGKWEGYTPPPLPDK